MAGSVRFTPTRDDYVAANRAWMRHFLRRRPMRWLIGQYLATILLGAVFAVVAEQRLDGLLPMLGLGALFAGRGPPKRG
jgi:hypothetical protein